MPVILADALRFTLVKTQALLYLHDRPSSAQALYENTDGWAAAMVLMLAARTDLAMPHSAGTGIAPQTVFDLFAGEVMDAVAPL